MTAAEADTSSKTVRYNLGCNFDPTLPARIAELNSKYARTQRVISDVYGSDRAHAQLTARPAFRLPDITRHNFEDFVLKLNDVGVGFNYTLNAVHPYSKRELLRKKQEIVAFVRYLESAGVRGVVLTNPLLIELVREASSRILLEVSTIAHIDTVMQIAYLDETYQIDKVCGNLLKNRNLPFLRAVAAYCKSHHIIYELMVNEFCSVGSVGFATHCVYRDACYLHHTTNATQDDADSFDGFPMNRCILARQQDPVNWLRCGFIRPEDVPLYLALGLSHFKITGRTGSTQYLMAVADAYLSGAWFGNLLGLWKPLETIGSTTRELDFHHEASISSRALDGFLDRWLTGDGFLCENQICGHTCSYCSQWHADLRDSSK
jgi:collagenase-like PrtC family protease